MRKTILVTGATGFLGNYIVKELIEQGYRVAAIGRNVERGKALEQQHCIFYPVDFTVKEQVQEVFKKEDVEGVIHAGALSSAWGRWEDFYVVNVEGTRQVAELALQYKVKRFVYVSSPSVYTAKCDRFDVHEEEADRSNHLNHYIATKLMSENILGGFCEKGLYVVILRPRGLIGRGDPSLMPRLMRANGKIGIPLFNGGGNIVDITCAENAAYACYLALKAENVKGEVFNITNDEPSRFRDVLEEFCQAAGEKANFRQLPFPLLYGAAEFMEWFYRLFHLKGEPVLTRYTVCTLAFSQTLNIDKAKEKLHYMPKKTLKEGIADYGKWWNSV